jgi:hypothetical protein
VGPDRIGSGPRVFHSPGGTDDVPVVHEFRLDAATRVYVPAPVPEHSGFLRTDFPYSVEIDLRAIVGDL